MKKLMFVLAFAFAATLAFATNSATGGVILPNPEPSTVDINDIPCMACKMCNDILICKISTDCQDAIDELQKELEERGCAGPKKDAPQGDN